MNKKEIFRAIKFTLISMSAGAIQMGSFALMNEVFHWSYWVCYLVAIILSVIWNFTINRRYTFKSDSNIKRAMLLTALFYLVFTPASTWLENYLTTEFLWNEYLVTFLNMFLNLVLEFLYQRLLVYGKSVDTNSVAQKEQSQKESTEDKA